jgi:hypothetical protein
MEILERVKSLLPEGVVSRIELEGCEIIIYTMDREFFLSHEPIVRGIVEEVKKRIEVRAEKELRMEATEAKRRVLEIVPQEAGITDVYFEPERGLMIIASKKPGIVIGKKGETLRRTKYETFWVPRIERIPPIESKIITGIRAFLHREVRFRKRFFNQVGKSIFTPRETGRDWIRIIGLGGWREVGRSCMLIETPRSKVLVDCGVNVGATGTFVYPYLQVKELDLAELDAVIISHPHLDHVGCIPFLFENGYQGPLYCTHPTQDLFTLLCLDYIDVMQRSGKKPPFTAKGVKEAIKRTITLEYNEVTDVAPDVRLTYQNAGHLLGSALVHLHIGEGVHNIVYACDLKYGISTLFTPAFTNFARIETLVLESTYGSKADVMPPRHEAEEQLLSIIGSVMERQGIVLIPAFAVGRAQDVIAILAQAGFEYPLFIDGMIWDATGIYTAYPEYFKRSIQQRIFRGEDPFRVENFKRIASPEEREKAWEERPCVILSTSGMMTGGPVLEHLKALAEDPRNMLLFVGFQAAGTLGRRIQKGWKEIPLEFEEGKAIPVRLNLEVGTIEGLSAHSDKNQLLSFVGRLRAKPRKVVVVHGENRKTIELAKSIHRLFGIETIAPRNLEAIRLR